MKHLSESRETASVALGRPDWVLEHVDLHGIKRFVDDAPESLFGLIKLALSSGREQMAAVNRPYGEADAPKQRLAIHNLLNTFTLLHAKAAVLTARRAERYVAASFGPLGPVLLTELNDAFRAVESDLEQLLAVGDPELRID